MDLTQFMNPIEESAEIDVGDLYQDVLNEFIQVLRKIRRRDRRSTNC